MFKRKLSDKKPHITNVDSMRLKLLKLQNKDKQM